MPKTEAAAQAVTSDQKICVEGARVHNLKNVDVELPRNSLTVFTGLSGSGKSSLLFYLKDVLVKQGYDLFSWSLHDQNRFLPESFWMELQKFLQKTPVLLPTNFLLPPPVMTSEEYTAQRREFLKEIFPDRDFDQEAARSDGGETEEEFRVSSTESASRSPDEVVDAKKWEETFGTTSRYTMMTLRVYKDTKRTVMDDPSIPAEDVIRQYSPSETSAYEPSVDVLKLNDVDPEAFDWEYKF